MKIKVNRDVLSNMLSLASKAVATRSALPEYACFHMKADVDARILRVSAFNGDMLVEDGVAFVLRDENPPVPADRYFAVPAKVMTDILATLSSGEVEIDFLANGEVPSMIVLSEKGSKNELRCLGDGTWLSDTAAKTELATSKFALTADEVSKIAVVAFAASTDESRPVLQGIHLRGKKGEKKLVTEAADGFMLAHQEITLNATLPADVDAVIPAKLFYTVEGKAASAEMEINEVQATLRPVIEGSTRTPMVRCNLINGTFPQVDQILVPTLKAPATQVNGIRAKALTSYIKRQRAIGATMFYIGVADDAVRTHAKSEESGVANDTILTTEGIPDSPIVALNGVGLMLKSGMLDELAAQSPTISLKIAASNSPVLIQGGGLNVVIMPMVGETVTKKVFYSATTQIDMFAEPAQPTAEAEAESEPEPEPEPVLEPA